MGSTASVETGENVITTYQGTPISNTVRSRDLREKLNTLLHPNIPGKIYNSMHGGHFDFTSDDTKEWTNGGSEDDLLLPIELATAIVPDNLFVIHFYRLNTVGYGDKEIEITIRKGLKYMQDWIVDKTQKILEQDEIPEKEQLEEATIGNSGHLYYPGESMYNSKLSFDWGEDSSNIYDVFNLDDPKSGEQERKYMETDPFALADTIGRRPIKLAENIKTKTDNGEDYLDFIQEKGKTFSQLAALNFVSNYTHNRNDLFKNPRWIKNYEQINRKNKDDISMQQFLNYISANTEREKMRVVFIFNCDPYLNSTNTTRALRYGRTRTTNVGEPIMTRKDYNTIQDLRNQFNVKGVNNLRKYLKSVYNINPRAAAATRSGDASRNMKKDEKDTPRYGLDPSHNSTQRNQYHRDYRGTGKGSGGNWLANLFGNFSDKCWWESDSSNNYHTGGNHHNPDRTGYSMEYIFLSNLVPDVLLPYTRYLGIDVARVTRERANARLNASMRRAARRPVVHPIIPPGIYDDESDE